MGTAAGVSAAVPSAWRSMPSVRGAAIQGASATLVVLIAMPPKRLAMVKGQGKRLPVSEHLLEHRKQGPNTLIQDVDRFTIVDGLRPASRRPALHLLDGTLDRRHQVSDDDRHLRRGRFGRLLKLSCNERQALEPKHAGAAGQNVRGPRQGFPISCGNAWSLQALPQRLASSDKGAQISGNDAGRKEGGGPHERLGVTDRQVRPDHVRGWVRPARRQ